MQTDERLKTEIFGVCVQSVKQEARTMQAPPSEAARKPGAECPRAPTSFEDGRFSRFSPRAENNKPKAARLGRLLVHAESQAPPRLH